MVDVVSTTPLGKRYSIISRASRKVELKAGVRRLSGGEVKLRR